MTVRTACAVIGISFVLLASAGAATIYVDVNQTTNAEDGVTWATAWDTLTEGVVDLAASNALAQGGHTVEVASGTYTDIVTFVNGHSGGASPNTLRAPNADATISGQTVTIDDCSNIVINGFTVRDAAGSGFRLTGVNPSLSDDVTLTNCIARGCGGAGFHVAQKYITGFTMARCMAFDCQRGIYMFYNSQGAARDCIFYGNALDGVYTLMVGIVRMVNCIVVGNGAFGLNESHRQGGIATSNCLFYANGRGNLYHSGHPPVGETPTGIFETKAEIEGVIDPPFGIYNYEVVVGSPGFSDLANGWNFNEFYSDSPALTNGVDGNAIGPYPSPPTIGVANATYYVDDTTGDDARTSLQAQNPASPWKSIAKAATVAAAGDTVSVAAGTYTGRVDIVKGGSSDNPVRYEANGVVVVDGQNTVDRGFALDRVGDVILDGFEVTDFTESGVYQAHSFSNMVRNGSIHDSGAQGVWLNRSSRAAFQGMAIYSNLSYGVISQNGSGGVTLDRCTLYGQPYAVRSTTQFLPSHMRNCDVYDNTYGVRAANNCGSTEIENCVFYNNTRGYSATLSGGSPQIKNTIFANNEYGLYEEHPQFQPQPIHCDFYGSSSYHYWDYSVGHNDMSFINGLAGATNNIDVDPKFLDAANGDFRLHETSPCIDVGTETTTLATDMYGNQRLYGDAVDIGSFEYIPKPEGTVVLIK